MKNSADPIDIHKLMNSLPVLGEDGKQQEIKSSTRFTSDVAPLIYQDGRLVKSDDYVIHIRFEEGIAVSAEFAQVWATLYYGNGQPIGVSLKPANHQGTPTISMFTTTDDDCNQQLYFRTTVTYDQSDTNKYILPLNYRNEEISEADSVWCNNRLIELSKDNAIALFALALLEKNTNKKQSIDYLIQASHQGYAHAFTQLSWYFKNDNNNPEKWIDALKLGAAANDPRAKYELAFAYVSGNQVEINERRAVDLLKNIAGRYYKAYFELSKYYRYNSFNTHLTNQLDYDSDYSPPLESAMKIVMCFDTLADTEWSGKVLSKFYLADCYEHGIGCDVDLDIAEQLYEEVVVANKTEYMETIEAKFRLAKFKMTQGSRFIADGNHALGRGIYQETLKMIKTIANKDYVPAQLYLANELLCGERFEKNSKLATSLLNTLNYNQLSKKDKNIARKLSLLGNNVKNLPKNLQPIAHFQHKKNFANNMSVNNVSTDDVLDKKNSSKRQKVNLNDENFFTTVNQPDNNTQINSSLAKNNTQPVTPNHQPHRVAYEESNDESDTKQIFILIGIVLLLLIILCGFLIAMS